MTEHDTDITAQPDGTDTATTTSYDKRATTGTVALIDRRARRTGVASAFRSDRCAEFVECRRDTQMLVAGFDAEFAMAASQVLDERVPADHHTRGPVGSSTAHWPESCLESSVIALDLIVPVSGRVVEHFWEQIIDNAQQRSCEIRGDFSWPVTARQHCLEELGGRCDVAAFRHRNLDAWPCWSTARFT
jgi:hypothetical protein